MLKAASIVVEVVTEIICAYFVCVGVDVVPSYFVTTRISNVWSPEFPIDVGQFSIEMFRIAG